MIGDDGDDFKTGLETILYTSVQMKNIKKQKKNRPHRPQSSPTGSNAHRFTSMTVSFIPIAFFRGGRPGDDGDDFFQHEVTRPTPRRGHIRCDPPDIS